jgi:hypothetical protein
MNILVANVVVAETIQDLETFLLLFPNDQESDDFREAIRLLSAYGETTRKIQ